MADIDAAFFLGGLGVVMDGVEPLMQKLGRERCLQTIPEACRRGVTITVEQQ
jgi:hypothetical protein